MKEKKKIRVKVKKRKLKIKRILVTLLIIIILILSFLYIKKLPITNIYIIGNKNITDKEIIKSSGISTYPSFIETKKTTIKNKLLKNDYIKEVTVEKKFFGKVYINITEKKMIALYNDKVLTEDNLLLDNIYNETKLPILSGDISVIREKLTKKFKEVNDDVLLKISEISYAPNEVDNERFILKMNDGNMVYVTLTKITKINKYNSIYSGLEGKKGIIYLDSGDYVEVKE